MSSLQALLEKGYFPRELPPPFNTDTFASFAFSHGAAWNTKSWQMKMSKTTTSAQGEPKAAANSGGITGGSGGQLKKGKFTYV